MRMACCHRPGSHSDVRARLLMFRKRSKVARALESWKIKRERRLKKEKAKRAQKAIDDAREAAIREATYKRDAGRCRATGVPLYLHHHNPFKVAHCHHKKYRSAGGSDEMFNRITLSPEAHVAEHDGYLAISGEPNGTLTFTQLDGYGKALKVWSSPCPSV